MKILSISIYHTAISPPHLVQEGPAQFYLVHPVPVLGPSQMSLSLCPGIHYTITNLKKTQLKTAECLFTKRYDFASSNIKIGFTRKSRKKLQKITTLHRMFPSSVDSRGLLGPSPPGKAFLASSVSSFI